MTLAETDRLAQFTPEEIDQAENRLAAFTKKFGQAHRMLAYHAAFPIALTPDMLYQLWNNFRQDMRGNLLRIPWVAVADLLLSDLCREVGHELYQMDVMVRELLLDELESHPAFGPDRLNTLAHFLDDYVTHSLDLSAAAPPDERALAQAQAWTALVYREPQQTAVAIAEQLQQLDWNNTTDLLEIGRLSRLLQTMARPLAIAGQTDLLAYGAVAGSLATGKWEEALALGQQMGLGTAVTIAGQKLPLPIAFVESLEAETWGDADTAVPTEITTEDFFGPVMRLGFQRPDGLICDLHTPLAAGSEYLFLVSTGPSEDSAPVSFSLPTDDLSLDVVVFPLASDLHFPTDRATMRLRPDPAAMMQKFAPPSPDLIGERVALSLVTPREPGVYRFRCHVVYRQMVLQSRLVQITVAAQPTPRLEPQMTAVLDYTLLRRWQAQTLGHLRPTRLSLFVGDEQVYMLPQSGPSAIASFSPAEWSALTERLRQSLRRAAWGHPDSFRPGDHYRYGGQPEWVRMATDLVTFARAGYRLYDALFGRMTPTDPYATLDVANALQTPALIQIAAAESSPLTPHLALLYDYPLDEGLPVDKFSLCPEFEMAWHKGLPLAESDCFQGRCPSRARPDVVCPSGFWGFRHFMAQPLSVGEETDAPMTIDMAQRPSLALHLSTNPALTLRDEHVGNLYDLLKKFGGQVRTAVTRAESLTMLTENEAQVAYFYCRAGVKEGRPWLQVGPLDEKGVTRANLARLNTNWSGVRPLVFLNAIQSASLTPETGRDLFNGFLESVGASGLIVPDMTALEPFATRFAEEFLRSFLLDRQPAGEALRQARLRLLQVGNPLGLIYTLYALPDLRLEQTAGWATTAA
jgi:hypothetical protein